MDSPNTSNDNSNKKCIKILVGILVVVALFVYFRNDNNIDISDTDTNVDVYNANNDINDINEPIDNNTYSNKMGGYMLPTENGSFKNTYPRGKCINKSLERRPCMVGNCPIGSNITSDAFCYIQCAQDPDNYEDCAKFCKKHFDTC